METQDDLASARRRMQRAVRDALGRAFPDLLLLSTVCLRGCVMGVMQLMALRHAPAAPPPPPCSSPLQQQQRDPPLPPPPHLPYHPNGLSSLPVVDSLAGTSPGRTRARQVRAELLLRDAAAAPL